MKKLQININKKAVFEQVSLNTAYAGAKTATPDSDYERVATLSADQSLLSLFWTDICGQITDKLKDFIVSTENTAEEFRLNLSLSGSYDESMNESVAADLSAAAAAGITARWFRYTFPSQAEESGKETLRLLESACAKLCLRRKPVRNL